LKAAMCTPDTPALDKLENHHDLVKAGINVIVKDETITGGTLGRKNGVKYRVYMRLSRYYDENKGTLYINENFKRALDDIYRFPIKESAIDVLSRQMKSGISDNVLSDLIISLKEEDKLCIVNEDEVQHKLPQIICSLGIVNGEGVTTK
jgi:hypothetical protein